MAEGPSNQNQFENLRKGDKYDMISEENGQNLNCTLTFIKPKMNDSGLYTVKETVDESRDVNFQSFLGSFQVKFWPILLIRGGPFFGSEKYLKEFIVT